MYSLRSNFRYDTELLYTHVDADGGSLRCFNEDLLFAGDRYIPVHPVSKNGYVPYCPFDLSAFEEFKPADLRQKDRSVVHFTPPPCGNRTESWDRPFFFCSGNFTRPSKVLVDDIQITHLLLDNLRRNVLDKVIRLTELRHFFELVVWVYEFSAGGIH